MTIVSLQEAQAKLPELIRALEPGEELVITENEAPIARLVASPLVRPAHRLGSLRGTVVSMAPDFDAPLDDFKEYV